MEHENKNITYENNQYKLFLTYNAQEKIKKLMLKNTEMLGLRISIKKSGCAGFGYIFYEVIEKNLDYTDIVFQFTDKIKLFVPYKVISFIHGSELDYVNDGLNFTFKFKNPNIKHLCGCGESFNIPL